MAGTITLSSKSCCFVKDSMKDQSERITQRLRVASESIDSNWLALGKVIKQGQYQYDLSITIQVIREHSETLDAIREEAIKAIDRLGHQSTSCCGIATERLVQWLSNAMEPLTLLGGIVSLASEAFKDAALRDPRWAIVGIGLCVGSGFVSKITHCLLGRVNTFDRNKTALERGKEGAEQKISETTFILSLFERLDELSKVEGAPKAREWRHLAFDAQHIPKSYHHLLDPQKFKEFIKARSPRTRFRHVVQEAMQKHKQDQKQLEIQIPVVWHTYEII